MIYQTLRQILFSNSSIKKILLAYSGGIDSSVLLHALVALKKETGFELSAIHINHQLTKRADEWQKHCESVCANYLVPLTVVSVDVSKQPGDSLEANARLARQRAFISHLCPETTLLTAHHQDDQLETVLYRLMRGAGVKGLSAMKPISMLGTYSHIRPLLEVNRSVIDAYANTHQLSWIEDDSNALPDFDRNYLRHQVIPSLKKRWPAAAEVVARSARHCQDASCVLEQLALNDFNQCRIVGNEDLSCSQLKTLPVARRMNVLRHWITKKGAPPPSEAQLKHIVEDVLLSRVDAQGIVSWPESKSQRHVVRRYRDTLCYALESVSQTGQQSLAWQPGKPFPLEGIKVERLKTPLSKLETATKPISIRYRQGGESVRPEGRGGSCSLKKLLQENGIPPWLRQQIPLLYIGEDIAEVIGVCRCELPES